MTFAPYFTATDSIQASMSWRKKWFSVWVIFGIGNSWHSAGFCRSPSRW